MRPWSLTARGDGLPEKLKSLGSKFRGRCRWTSDVARMAEAFHQPRRYGIGAQQETMGTVFVILRAACAAAVPFATIQASLDQRGQDQADVSRPDVLQTG